MNDTCPFCQKLLTKNSNADSIAFLECNNCDHMYYRYNRIYDCELELVETYMIRIDDKSSYFIGRGENHSFIDLDVSGGESKEIISVDRRLPFIRDIDDVNKYVILL